MVLVLVKLPSNVTQHVLRKPETDRENEWVGCTDCDGRLQAEAFKLSRDESVFYSDTLI